MSQRKPSAKTSRPQAQPTNASRSARGNVQASRTGEDPRETALRAAENVPILGELATTYRKGRKEMKNATGIDLPYSGVSAAGAAELVYDLASGKRSIQNPFRYADADLAPTADAIRDIATRAVATARPVAPRKQRNNATGTVVAAPAAMSTASKNHGPTVREVGGKTVVKHREYVNDIVLGLDAAGEPRLGGAFDIDYAMSVNPGDNALFPMLASIARNFQFYRFRKLEFATATSNGTSTPGSIAIAFNPDSDDAMPGTKREMLNLDGAVRGPIWAPMVQENAAHRNTFLTQRFVRGDSIPASADIKTYDCGSVIIGSSDMADGSAPHVDLFVDYEVELSVPVLQEDPYPCLLAASPYAPVPSWWPAQGLTRIPLIQEASAFAAKALVQSNGGTLRLPEAKTMTLAYSGGANHTLQYWDAFNIYDVGTFLASLNLLGSVGETFGYPCFIINDPDEGETVLNHVGLDNNGVGAIAPALSGAGGNRYDYHSYPSANSSNPDGNTAMTVEALICVKKLPPSGYVSVGLGFRLYADGVWSETTGAEGQGIDGVQIRVVQVSSALASSTASTAMRAPPSVPLRARSVVPTVDYKTKYEATLKRYEQIASEVRDKFKPLPLS